MGLCSCLGIHAFSGAPDVVVLQPWHASTAPLNTPLNPCYPRHMLLLVLTVPAMRLNFVIAC